MQLSVPLQNSQHYFKCAILTFFLVFYLIYFRRSGRERSDLEHAVEFQKGTL